MDPLPKGLTELATQGTGWVLFLALIPFAGWCLKGWLDTLKANGELAKVVALALRESGEANGALAQSIRDRTPAFDALSQVVMQGTRDTERDTADRKEWQQRHDQATREIHDEQIEVRRLLDKREGRT
jgi:hypothetical protein